MNFIAFRNGRGSSNQSSDSEGSTHDLIGPGASRGNVMPGCGLFTGVPIVESIDYEAKKLLATKGALDYNMYNVHVLVHVLLLVQVHICGYVCTGTCTCACRCIYCKGTSMCCLCSPCCFSDGQEASGRVAHSHRHLGGARLLQVDARPRHSRAAPHQQRQVRGPLHAHHLRGETASPYRVLPCIYMFVSCTSTRTCSVVLLLLKIDKCTNVLDTCCCVWNRIS